MFSSLLATSIWDDVVNFFANFEDVTGTCTTIMLWLAIALTIAFIACKFAVKKQYQHKVNLISLIVALAFSLACIITFVVCSFIEDEIVAITFYPLLALAIVCVLGGLAIAVKPARPVQIAAGCAVAAALIAALVCMIVYYESGDAPEWNWVSPEDVNNVGLYVSCAALVAAIVALALLSDRNAKPFDSRSMAFAAMCVAISFALSYVKFFEMPMGGSITFASMPEYKEEYTVEQTFTCPVSFNGKLRYKLELSKSLSAQEIEKIVRENENTAKYLAGNAIKKIVVVPGKIINVVC